MSCMHSIRYQFDWHQSQESRIEDLLELLVKDMLSQSGIGHIELRQLAHVSSQLSDGLDLLIQVIGFQEVLHLQMNNSVINTNNIRSQHTSSLDYWSCLFNNFMSLRKDKSKMWWRPTSSQHLLFVSILFCLQLFGASRGFEHETVCILHPVPYRRM